MRSFYSLFQIKSITLNGTGNTLDLWTWGGQPIPGDHGYFFMVAQINVVGTFQVGSITQHAWTWAVVPNFGGGHNYYASGTVQ